MTISIRDPRNIPSCKQSKSSLPPRLLFLPPAFFLDLYLSRSFLLSCSRFDHRFPLFLGQLRAGLLKRRSLRNIRGSCFLVRSSSRDNSFGCEGSTAESGSDFFEAMSSESKKSSSNGNEKLLTSEEQQAKINELRRLIGTAALPEKLSIYCSDASLARHLRARNWNVKKATKMLKDTLKWRSENKPEEIRWEDIAHEAETGKIYRSNYVDKHGRTVLVMRPSHQNSKSTKGQIKYLVYCMENAILNLPSNQEQMVWLIDFQGFNMSHISVKVTKETAHVLQDQYPERLGVAILYNPPKFFEPFFSVVKPFLEPKTYNKVKFVYSDDLNSKKIMEDLFDMDRLESAFGGNDANGFDIGKYAERMREDDKRMPLAWTRGSIPLATQAAAITVSASLDSITLSDSDPSDNEKAEDIMGGVESEIVTPIDAVASTNIGDNCSTSVHS
ncbi:hypothetical protein EUGRSUZ_F02445 [Eucalyptus grandis]|uniref:Uncharacterized protein n=2 Tax=Eucalyptus grandis TaxID=71139 RepID=A0ACC3LIB5_EUCGR|nr:hypothetical protein EUGRSUZ_F02445 [Eucalyptus grandis]